MRSLAVAPARRTLSLLALTLLAALSLASASAQPAAALAVTRHSSLTRGSKYLALGDSVTFGYQEAQVQPAPDYKNAASFLGYPEQVAAALHVKVTNLACPGETSASLINIHAPTLACENAYRKAYPLHLRYKGSQLAYTIPFLRTHKDVRLVSLMIGANDAFRCQAITADKCTSPAELTALHIGISHNVTRILSAIRHQAHYTGQLAIVNYYSLDYLSAASNEQSLELNIAVDTAAKPFHVVIADGYREFQRASVRFDRQPCLAGLLTALVGGTAPCGIHPSYTGQALLAQALEKAIRL